MIEKSSGFLEGRGSALYLGHSGYLGKIGLLHRVQPEKLGILCKIQGTINLRVENDQPLGNVLEPAQFGIKLLITDALPEECTSFWGSK